MVVGGEQGREREGTKYTYSFGTSGVDVTFGLTTCPMANMPPPSLPSRQCEKTLFTFPDAASCDISDEFACPKPIIPSTA